LISPPRHIAVIGLGYVGLPVAVAFAKLFPGTLGFDVDTKRVDELLRGSDKTGEIDAGELLSSGLKVTARVDDLRECDVFIVCVPTPIHEDRRPNLGPLKSASETVGKVLRKGGIVVYESTVYPGLTEDYCGPILAHVSGLIAGTDFTLGYSPEHINPGDKEHTFERIKKVVAAEDTAMRNFWRNSMARWCRLAFMSRPASKSPRRQRSWKIPNVISTSP